VTSVVTRQLLLTLIYEYFCHDIAEMLMKVAPNTRNLTPCKHAAMTIMSSHNLSMSQLKSRYLYVVFVFSSATGDRVYNPPTDSIRIDTDPT
jgi:hypothetical protein